MIMDLFDRMTVTVPEGEADGMRVERFTFDPHTVQGIRYAMAGRAIPAGTYTRLMESGSIWMSDTPAEKSDHWEAVNRIREGQARRVLINGLGLGMVLTAALSYGHVQHVDVVERDPRVIELVGPHYQADPRVNIVHGDAFEIARRGWAPGRRWDVGWSDIWPELNTDDLIQHAVLNRSYGRRCTWHECWAHDELLYQRDRDRREEKRMEGWLS
jgi:hypothetical protein